MRFWLFILVISAGLAAMAAEKPQAHISKKDRQAAEREFKRALELEKSGHMEDAMIAASTALQLYPGNSEYLTAHEMLRQQMVGGYLERGNALAVVGDNAGAAKQFQQALTMDPLNTYVAQRLRDVSFPEDPDRQRTLQLLASADQIDLAPVPGKHTFRIRSDTKSAYSQIGQLFKVSVQFDEGVNNRVIEFGLTDVDFYTAMGVLGKMTKTFWAPVSRDAVIVASDSAEMRRQYERLSLRTFYMGGVTSAADLTDLANVLRNIFEMKTVSIDASQNTLTVKAPRAVVEAAASLLDNLMDAKPEIMLDVQALEIDTNKNTQYGVNLPTSFEAFNIPSEIRRVLGPNAQSVIDQLSKNGTIDPGSISPSALANLQNSPLLAPFILVGKGEGLTGITTRPISGQLSMTSSVASTLEHVTLRAIDGETATFRVGERFPILSSTFSTIAVSSQGAARIGNTPQFQYEDLGLTLKVKPHYQADDGIRLDFELNIEGLGATSLNNIPELTNRAFKGNITVKAGEPSVIAGEISDQELRSTQGYPAFGQVPGLKSVLNTNSNQPIHNEILVVVTPHVIRKPFHDKGNSAFWLLNP